MSSLVMQNHLKKNTPSAALAAKRAAADRLILVVVFLLIFAMAARTPLDSDMWWHLRAGSEILDGRWLSSDIFTFTRAGEHWTNAMWLSQVSMALVFRLGGYLGIGALIALLATLSMVLVERQCEGPIVIRVIALLLGSIVASTCWPPRPLVVSLVLLALVGYLLFLNKWQEKDLLWALPPIFILWSNMHGGYPLGLILIGANIAGEILNHSLGEDQAQNVVSSPLPWRKIGKLGLIGLLCGLAVLVNPNGLHMWALPFQTVGIQSLLAFIPEWGAPDFHVLVEQSLLWLLFAVIVAVALSGRRMDGADLVSLLIFAYMAMVARRNFGAFALVAVPVLSRYAAVAFDAWKRRVLWLARFVRKLSASSQGQVGASPLLKGLNLLIVAMLGFVAFGKLYVVTHPVLVEHYLEAGYPVSAVQYLQNNTEPGSVLNEYDWGGYLQLVLKDYPIFIDGRTDLFGDEVIGEWNTALQAEDGWQDILDRYQVDYVMLRPDRPLLAELSVAGWKRLHEDAVTVVYARP